MKQRDNADDDDDTWAWFMQELKREMMKITWRRSLRWRYDVMMFR